MRRGFSDLIMERLAIVEWFVVYHRESVKS